MANDDWKQRLADQLLAYQPAEQARRPMSDAQLRAIKARVDETQQVMIPQVLVTPDAIDFLRQAREAWQDRRALLEEVERLQGLTLAQDSRWGTLLAEQALEAHLTPEQVQELAQEAQAIEGLALPSHFAESVTRYYRLVYRVWAQTAVRRGRSGRPPERDDDFERR